MFKPSVSIIMPMYNSEKYVAQSLQSVLNQTYQNFELIVVDDCSTDDSVEIVKSFIPKFDGRLNLIAGKKNTGSPGIPRNVAIKNSHGKYIMFIDSDDLIMPNSVESLYNIAEDTKADVLHAERYYVPIEDINTDANKRGGGYESRFENLSNWLFR